MNKVLSSQATKIKYETYPLYMTMTACTLLILMAIWGIFMYFLWPGLSIQSRAMAFAVEIGLSLIPLLYLSLWLIMTLAIHKVLLIPPLLLRVSNRGLYSIFPFTFMFGKLVGISKDRLSQSLIDLINTLVQYNLFKVSAERILLLTPHCLQKDTCIHKVTSDVTNCKQCGQCHVGELLTIAKEYGCQFVVVTGGTLARMMVKKARPKAIVAIACERDLVSGMQDVFPIPVIGILNERPCGPCCNTRVDILKVEKVVKSLIYGYK